MQWLVGNLRDHPEIALFLVLAIGAWVGSLKFKGFSLGVVTSTLLAGVLVGQLNIVMSSNVKSCSSSCFCSPWDMAWGRNSSEACEAVDYNKCFSP